MLQRRLMIGAAAVLAVGLAHGAEAQAQGRAALAGKVSSQRKARWKASW